MKKITLLSLFGLILIITGCGYMAPVMPPQGGIVTNIKAPLDTDVEETDLGNKSGKAASISVLSLFAFGDCSISKAAKNADIKKVTHADYRYLNVLFIFQRFQVIVYGE